MARDTAARWLLAPLAGCLMSAAAAQPSTAGAALDDGVAQAARSLIEQAVHGSRRDAARVEVKLGNINPRLTLAPCQRIEPYLPAGSRPLGRTYVGLRCTDGVARWNITVPVTVSLYAPAVVLRQALPAGTMLHDGHLTLAEIDWGLDGQRALSDLSAALGRELQRPLAAGAPLQTTDFKLRQYFAAGDTVQLLARGPGFVVQGEGQALSPGIEGQAVRVRTASGSIVTGRLVGERRVEVLL